MGTEMVAKGRPIGVDRMTSKFPNMAKLASLPSNVLNYEVKYHMLGVT